MDNVCLFNHNSNFKQTHVKNISGYFWLTSFLSIKRNQTVLTLMRDV